MKNATPSIFYFLSLQKIPSLVVGWVVDGFGWKMQKGYVTVWRHQPAWRLDCGASAPGSIMDWDWFSVKIDSFPCNCLTMVQLRPWPRQNARSVKVAWVFSPPHPFIPNVLPPPNQELGMPSRRIDWLIDYLAFFIDHLMALSCVAMTTVLSQRDGVSSWAIIAGGSVKIDLWSVDWYIQVLPDWPEQGWDCQRLVGCCLCTL